MSFECGLEIPKFHKTFILYNIMLKVPHSPSIYYIVVAKCGSKAPTFHQIFTHSDMSKNHLVIV